MVSFYELIAIVAIDYLIMFDINAGNGSKGLSFGTNPTMFSLLRNPSGRGLNTFLGKHSLPIKLSDVRSRKWSHVKSSSMKYTDIDNHILGHDYDRFDVTKDLSDFIIDDNFFHELLLHCYKLMGSDTLVLDRLNNPLVNDKFLQVMILNTAYFMFIAQMEYGNSAMKVFTDNRSLINSPQWLAIIKIGRFSKLVFETSLKLQLTSSSAITNSMNRKLAVIKGKQKGKSDNSFLNNGPAAPFPTNITLVYLTDLNNNLFRYIENFSDILNKRLNSGMLDNASISNTNIFRSNANSLIEKKLAARLKAYMFIVTESRDQFDSVLMSGGAWLNDNKAAYLATWRFSNTRLSKDIYKTIKFSEMKFD